MSLFLTSDHKDEKEEKRRGKKKKERDFGL